MFPVGSVLFKNTMCLAANYKGSSSDDDDDDDENDGGMVIIHRVPTGFQPLYVS